MLHVTTDRGVNLENGKDLKADADEAIADFDKYFQSLPNDPLSGPEKAILSTFIWFMVRVQGRAEPAPVSSGTDQR